jgi:hypothetical protein
MAKLKTAPTKASVDAFVRRVPDAERRADCRTLAALMREVTGEPPRLWGDSIVGFGSYHYRYESGREGDWFLTGFSPRKNDLTVYITAGFERYGALMKKLGRHKTGRACLYLRRLADVDLGVLRDLVARSVAQVRAGSAQEPAARVGGSP